MAVYYNEIDAEKAAWIRELVKAGVVAPGEVDERDIKLVQPEDLRGYTQCHFFAGIAVWSYALRLAGWDDSREVWTGSCPCPSFSSAGKGEGFDDPRHLWPEWYRLIRKRRPGTIFGEQVDAAIRHGWLDLVCGNLEAEEYAIAAAVLGAHSAGAPHIRQRLYFCAHTAGSRCDEARQHGSGLSLLSARSEQRRGIGKRCEPNGAGSLTRREAGAAVGHGSSTDPASSSCGGADAMHTEWWPHNQHGEDGRNGPNGGRSQAHGQPGACGEVRQRPNAEHDGHNRAHGTEAITDCDEPAIGIPDGNSATGRSTNATESRWRARIGSDDEGQLDAEGRGQDERIWRGPGWLDPVAARSASEAGATRGFWADCDWWYGRDGKYRPIEPGLFPLATKSPARVLRLRGYGDAIVAQLAKAFIEAYCETD